MYDCKPFGAVNWDIKKKTMDLATVGKISSNIVLKDPARIEAPPASPPSRPTRLPTLSPVTCSSPLANLFDLAAFVLCVSIE
jgi:hypothetical protein